MKLDNILIVNTFGIGDVLFSMPLLNELKRSLPDSRIYYLCNRRNHELLENNPDISGLIVYEKDEIRGALKKSKIKFLKGILGLAKDIRGLKIDAALDLTLNYQVSVILMLAGIGKRIGFNYKKRGKLLTHKIELSSFEKKHVVEHYLDLLKFLNLPVSKGLKIQAYSSKDDKVAADNFFKEKSLAGKRLVGIAAGGGKSWGKDAVYRRWDSDNFAYVGKKLSEIDNMRILIFGTPEEDAICEDISKKIGERAVSLCGTTSLGLLVEFLSRCDLLICNEGGPLHLAVSQDIKTISIFGPVDDTVYGPYPPSDKHKVIKARGVECRPCYKNFKHDLCSTHRCLTEIDKEEVLKIARDSLRYNNPGI